jgi:hypothetical protein
MISFSVLRIQRAYRAIYREYAQQTSRNITEETIL